MEALQRLHNRGSISTGFDIDNSLKFETDNSEYLKAEGRGQGNQQTWTWSCWVKRTEVDNGVVAQYLMSAGSDGKLGIYFRDDASYPDDRIFLYIDEGNSLKWIGQVNQSFRDTSAWYHIVLAVDSTDSTAADRTKIYINGVQQTITFDATLNQNVSTRIGDSGGKLSIGAKMDGSYGFNGYMAECVLVDGSALAPTEFGEVDEDSGIWKPIDVSSLSLGTQGFHMNFDDSSNVGAVQSGTSQGNFDKYNLSAADQATDTPTNNFATMNPLVPTADVTVSEGGTKVAASGGVSSWDTSFSSVGVTSGKWYFECRGTATDGTHFYGCVDESDIALVIDDFIGSSAGGPNAIGYYGNTGNIQINGSTVVSASSWPHNTTMALALDLDNGKAYFGRHNVWQNSADPAAGSNGISLPTAGTGTWFFAINASYFDGGSMNTNHGGYTAQTPDSAASDENGYGTFEFAPPSGYYALCTKNLEEFG